MSQENSTGTQLPSPNEKLPHKFLLDTLKQSLIEKNEPEQLEIQVTVEEIRELPNTDAPRTPLRSAQPLPNDKKYFRIGEAALVVGVEPYVLRYWETEFAGIRPMKSKSGQRVYSRNHVEDFLQIRRLLYIEKFSIKGAKKKLTELRQPPVMSGQTSNAPTQTVNSTAQRATLKQLAEELKQLIHFARTNPGSFVPLNS